MKRVSVESTETILGWINQDSILGWNNWALFEENCQEIVKVRKRIPQANPS